MKTIKNIILAGCLLAGVSACTSDFEDTNTNPNKTTVGQVQPTAMFEPLLYNGVNAWLNYSWYWSNELIQFTAFTGGTTRQEHRYFISDGNWQSVWNLYARYGNNAMHMYDLAIDKEDPCMQAVALTMKVLYMYNLTDIFGDIPYSEAFQANKPGGTTKPVFDSQQSVYEQMLAELETANEIYATNPGFTKPMIDGMYKGEVKKWRKFNNTLMMRLICRVSGRSEMRASERMQAILNNSEEYPLFESNDDNATVLFSGSDPYRNQFASTTEGDFSSSGRKLTRQLISMMVQTVDDKQVYEDPRLGIIGKKNTSTQSNPLNIWKGTIAGVAEEERNQADKGTSWLNAAVFCRADASGTFMDFAELNFILAEAALKGLIPGGESTAKSYYEKAVTASIEKWAPLGAYSEIPVTVTSDDIRTFLDSSLASWDKHEDKEELIGCQKFLALFWIGMEAYHEYRRTGYPELTIGNGAIYNDFILPTRFAYPNTTVATNKANVETALARMGGANDMKTPVWWSKQAINK